MHEEVGGEASLVVLVRAPEGSQAADSTDVGEEIAADLREHDGIESVHAFSDPGLSDPLSSDDGRTGMVVAHIEGTEAEQTEISTELVEDLTGERGDGAEVLVGGSAPMIASNSQQVMKDLGLAEGIAVPITLVLLPAVLGVVTLVFQHGWLSGFLGFTRGPLDMSMPVLLFCIAFGLSVDFELFLIGRMKELWEQTGSNRMAVVEGLAHTGRITTLAALVLSVSFAAFGTSQVSFMQLFGLGTAFAILLDATLVRGVLVPAFMRIAGRANWWAPAPLRWLHDRIGLAEAPEDPHTGPLAQREPEEFGDHITSPSARRRRGRHVADTAPRHRKGPW
ncbi:MMPL family transporter [Kocuria palustris]|nr:MMPL family transporter [Kocuria palustris]MBN6758036.1 MMPL family transporter [Kocuria palustris]MBN6763064.1 MMPL family transporter [Kocuria palustris]MBN6782395.1 MMPL family transporter [Kocuria palustris]MBN6799957.1 MMPL family transporter [Kocuria palustris]